MESVQMNYWIAPSMIFKISNQRKTDEIMRIISKEMHVPINVILSRLRKKNVVECRHMIVYFLCKYTTYSLSKVALILGGRDHSTIIHSKHVIADWYITDKNIKAYVDKFDALFEKY